jgi:tetratricopeptide (TPR) repeat protein
MIFTNTGNVYYMMGDYAQAADFMLKSLKLNEEMGGKPGIAAALNNLGSIYLGQGENARALEYLERSLKLAEEIGMQEIIASSLANIAQINYQLGKHQEALGYAGRAIALAHEEDRPDILWQARNIEGRVYAALDKLDSAQQSFLGSIAVIESAAASVDSSAFSRVKSRPTTPWLTSCSNVGRQRRPSLTRSAPRGASCWTC